MTTFTDSELEQIYHDARAIGSPEERAVFLERTCQGDDELRAKVEELLAADDQMGSFMEENAAAAVDFTIDDPVRERPGSQIGRYKLLEEIGEGGFGLVFIAQQHEPIERRVALKVIKPGMDTREVIARFEAERQALALMDHPHIAKVLDAGTTDSGRPYFVMELVRGLPITDYCDQSQLTLRDRLQLFAELGKAVQHAHQKGIIHRDIKPSNVLVTEQDGQPTVKIIDFGVAKALDRRLSQHSVYTRLQQMIGTPVYMSPEQTGMSGLDIDTRSDIYSLGVLLYELLTGCTPFDREQLARGALQEVQRIIREEDPPKPSSKLTDSGDHLPSIAAARHTEPAKLTRVVRGELDWIVMKCLEKDRNRRYDTALGLVHDIERYLHDEPVKASPPSRIYRLRKFAHRYRVPLAVGLAFTCVLVLGFGISVWQAVRATRSERLAEASAKRTERVLEYLVSAFRKPDPAIDGREVKVVDVLEQAMEDATIQLVDDPLERAALLDAISKSFIGLGLYDRAVQAGKLAYETYREALGADSPRTVESLMGAARAHFLSQRFDEAVGWSEESLAACERVFGRTDPKTLHSRTYLANCYQAVGQPQKAIEHFQQTLELVRNELGVDHDIELDCLAGLANCHQAGNDPKKAVAIYEQLLPKIQARRGEDHPHTLAVMASLALCYSLAGNAEQAIPLHEQIIRRMQEKFGEDHPETLTAKGNLALGLEYAGELGRAVAAYNDVLETMRNKLGDDDPTTLNTLGNLAKCYLAAGKPRAALSVCEEALERKRRVLGDHHPDTVSTMNNLGMVYGMLGDAEKSLSLMEQVVDIRRSEYGNDHPRSLISGNNLALSLMANGRTQEALPILEEVFALSSVRLGANDRLTLASMANLGDCYSNLGQTQKAIRTLHEALKKTTKQLGPDHPNSLDTLVSLANCVRNAGGGKLATPLLEQAVEVGKQSLGNDHPLTLKSMRLLAMSRHQEGDSDAALLLLREVLRWHREMNGDHHPDSLATMRMLAHVYMDQSHDNKAVDAIHESLRGERMRFSSADPQLASILTECANVLLRGEKDVEAEAHLRECLQIRQKVQPDDWHLFETKSMLGEALAGQGRFDEAEPLLREGFLGMKAHAESIPRPLPQDLKDGVQRLIGFYTHTKRTEEVARWQKESEQVQVAVDELREFAMAISVDVDSADGGHAQTESPAINRE